MEQTWRCYVLRERSRWWDRYMWWAPGIFRELYGAQRVGRIMSWIERRDASLTGWVWVRALVDESCDNEILASEEISLPGDFPLTGHNIGRTNNVSEVGIHYTQFTFEGVYRDNADKA
jgi:hypothetical protein